MKQILIIICLTFEAATAFSQLSTGNNFIVETDIKTPGITNQAGVDALPADKKSSTVTYFDGLGRPLQKVIIQGSPDLKDMIIPFYFDNQGNNSQIFLPYTDLSSNYGSLRTTAFQDQLTFYSPSNTSVVDIAKDNQPFTVLRFDKSPLNNLQAVGGPGANWNPYGGHPSTTNFSFISSGFPVGDSLQVHWTITSDSGAVPTAYLMVPLEAHKIISTDPQGNQTIDVYDIDYNLLTRRKYADTVALDTHYAYDNFNRLRYIMPPGASNQLRGKSPLWTVDSIPGIKEGYCYAYDYDARGRIIREKKPGVGMVEMVYDAQDRMVYKRDGNLLAKGQWLYYAYDALGKVTGTALWQTTNSRKAMQEKVNAYVYDSIVGNLFIPSPDYTPAISLTQTSYRTNGVASDPLLAFVPGEMLQLQNGNSTTADVVSTLSKHTDGLKYLAVTVVLDSTLTLPTYYYYDDKNRLIQKVSKNIKGGIDIKSIRYDYEGKILSTYDHYRNPKSTVTPEIKILTVRYYDGIGHLTQIDKQLNDSGSLKTIVQLRYNSVGQLLGKTLGNNLDSLKYYYHIQGWLKGVNKEYLRTGNGNYFGFDLGYDDSTSAITGINYNNRQYNGNIAGTIWRSANDNILRKYDFRYNKTDNLLRADFLQQDAGTSWSNGLVDYTVSGIKYDINSNILSLTQKGLSGTSSILIDSLKYEYLPNSNKLYYVTDKVNNPLSTLGDFKEANTDLQQDHDYDANGNQYLNMNKLTQVQRYNYLDQPDSIYMWGKGYVVYTYDANGNKLQKAVTDYTGTGKYTTISYLGDLEFRNDTLQSIIHEEGRIRVIVRSGQPVTYNYDYFEKDQLNNVRVILTEQTDTSIYSASMEIANAAKEEHTFSNIPATRSAKPPGYPASQGKEKNEFVALLSGRPDDKKTGPSLVLRVMAGDTVRIGANAFYKSNTVKKNNPALPLEGLLNQVLQGASSRTGLNTGHTTLLGEQPPLIANNLTPDSYERLKSGRDQTADPLRPKAYLNYIYFDDHFKMVEENSGTKQVKAIPDQIQELGTDKMVVSKSGYLYVFPGNESTERLYFDNLTVSLITGPLLEATHYYPSGLAMAGISSNALKGTNYPENKTKFLSEELQRAEFMDGGSLEWYDFKTSLYDQQVGRYLQFRRQGKFQEYLSPYHYLFNKPSGYTVPFNTNAVPPVNVLQGKAIGGNVIRNVRLLPLSN